MTYFDLFSEQQHGFRPKMSCVTQLLHVMEHWTKISDDGNDVDIIYLDFRKAFDCVPHQRLLSKLKAYGIAGSVLNWITDFLSNRRQRVKVKAHTLIGPVLQVVFHREVCLDHSSLLFILTIYLNLFKVILPFLPTTPSYIDLSLMLKTVIFYNLILISLLNGVKFG